MAAPVLAAAQAPPQAPAPSKQPPVPTSLTPIATRDQKIIRRWSLGGDPRGLAVGRNGTLYIGLAEPQAVIAVDPKSGAILRKLVLDSAEIASTKELVTLRTSRDGSRLFIANGSDESASVLALPDLYVVREIAIEGERIRDALPDPDGRFLYVLGRRVHVFDAEGKTELHTLGFEEPMAIATNANGSVLAVVGSEDFGGGNKATTVALYDTKTFAEMGRDPLQTDKQIEAALLGDNVLIAFSRNLLYEKPLSIAKPPSEKTMTAVGGQMHMNIDFGDLTSSERICLPEGSGAQIGALVPPNVVLFAEQRCSSSGGFTGSRRRIAPASLYGISAYALAYSPSANVLYATDRAGYLTIYRVPKAQ